MFREAKIEKPVIFAALEEALCRAFFD